jgi:LacI family transcriptional regulator
VEHLLGLGHRRIGYLGVTVPETNPWRFEGYCQALREAGLEPDDQLVVRSHADVEEGRAAAEQLLALPDPPTAIMAFDDSRAWGAWQAAEARGLEVGRDLAIVGYGDAPPPEGRAAELSTVHIDPHGMGQAAVQELSRLLSGEASTGRLVELPAQLVVRGSSREARRAAEAEGRA